MNAPRMRTYLEGIRACGVYAMMMQPHDPRVSADWWEAAQRLIATATSRGHSFRTCLLAWQMGCSATRRGAA